MINELMQTLFLFKELNIYLDNEIEKWTKVGVVWFGMWQEAHISKYKINIMRN